MDYLTTEDNDATEQINGREARQRRSQKHWCVCRARVISVVMLFLSETMKFFLFTFLIFGFCCLSVKAQANFDSSKLTEDGRKSYEILLSATKFTVGTAGYGGFSQEEKALHSLLKEKSAEEACLSLVDAANYEGGLYGLLGLRFLKSETYAIALEKYKARPSPPERTVHGKKVSAGEIMTMRGCFFWRKTLTEVLTELEAGSLDKEFESDGKPAKVLGKA